MKTALIVGAVAAVAVGAFFWFRRPGASDLAALRNDAKGPRLPAMPAMPDMPKMPSMPGMPTMPTMGNALNAPRLGPDAIFAGMWS